jgi:hypothetical protein
MTKQQLVDAFLKNHRDVVAYIAAMPADKLDVSVNGKWPPRQQLGHIYLTIVPFTRALASKEFIAEKFGKAERAGWDMDTVRANYLQTSRKAPEVYDPVLNAPTDIAELQGKIEDTLAVIQQHFENYTEEDMDSLVLPHPLLGKLSIREMFYLMSYHPLHHKKQIPED